MDLCGVIGLLHPKKKVRISMNTKSYTYANLPKREKVQDQEKIKNYKIRGLINSFSRKVNLEDVNSKTEFTCGGFIFIDKLTYDDPGDYFDFHYRVWTKDELFNDLSFGTLPIGMIVRSEGNPPMVVQPDELGQRLVPLTTIF